MVSTMIRVHKFAVAAVTTALLAGACKASGETVRLRRLVARSAEQWRQVACLDLENSYAVDIAGRADLAKDAEVRLLEAGEAARNAAELDTRYVALAHDIAILNQGVPGHVTDAFLQAHRRECPQPRS